MFHLAGLAMGLGGAITLDVMALKFMIRQKISSEIYLFFKHGSQVVFAGLLLLWLSGLAYLAYYAAYDPKSLSNHKVWAKLFIVVILSANGWLIHRYVSPLIHKNIGQPFLHGLTPRVRFVVMCSAMVSLVSWLTPLALGALKEFNFCVPAAYILEFYFAMLAIGLLLIAGFLHNSATKRVTS